MTSAARRRRSQSFGRTGAVGVRYIGFRTKCRGCCSWYTHFDPAVAIRGVVLNFRGSEGHAKGCAGAIERATTFADNGLAAA